MTTPDFYSAANVVPVILLAYVLQGWVQMHDIGLLVRERTELGSVANWIAAGVAILGYATLIPRYAAMGAALATLFAFAARYAIIYTLSQRLWPVRYRWAPVLRLAAIACAVGAIGYFLPQQQVLASVSTRLLLFAGYLVLAWNAGVLSAEERQILRNGIFSPGTVIAALRS
jgi:O-antigen/teichoic acid export membrane protein